MSLAVAPTPAGPEPPPPAFRLPIEEPTVVHHELRSRNKDGWKNKFLYRALTTCK